MQKNSLLETRIIELLTTTDLTFKEIILRLEAENLSASVGIIRRINRDNRYRQPRYDSKLTPHQREALVKELRDCVNERPNLSLLAKRYGVCHGSVWYWWDKLNRIKDPGRNPKKPPVKHKLDDLASDPDYSTIGRVNVLTSRGPLPLPIMMFAKKHKAMFDQLDEDHNNMHLIVAKRAGSWSEEESSVCMDLQTPSSEIGIA